MSLHIAECDSCGVTYTHIDARAVAQFVILHGGAYSHLDFLADEETHRIVTTRDPLSVLPTMKELGIPETEEPR